MDGGTTMVKPYFNFEKKLLTFDVLFAMCDSQKKISMIVRMSLKISNKV